MDGRRNFGGDQRGGDRFYPYQSQRQLYNREPDRSIGYGNQRWGDRFNPYKRQQYSGREPERQIHFGDHSTGDRFYPHKGQVPQHSREPERQLVNSDHSRGNRFNPPKRKMQHQNKESEMQIDPQYSRLIQNVQNQGRLGQLVVIQTENSTDSPLVTLQNALTNINIPMTIQRNPETNSFFLKIGSEEFATGEFANTQESKVPLASIALEKLKERCFFIYKKKNYMDISSNQLESGKASQDFHKAQEVQPPEEQPPMGAESAAHKMMLKMGWSGKGLGAQEQGRTETVTVYENIRREGFGTKNIMHEVSNLLSTYAKSSKMTTLAFDPSFTKEEREHIHKLALRFNLKSKSEGKKERRITISRKMNKFDIVWELLMSNGENDAYKLHVPSNFSNLLSE